MSGEADDRFDPLAPLPEAERYARLARLRRECPVVEARPGLYFVARQSGVLSVLRDVEGFVGTFGGGGESVADDEQIIQAIPEPRHGKIRRIMNAVLAPTKVARAERFIRGLCGELLDAILAGRDADLARTYADPIPTTTIAHVLGIPTEDGERFRRWSDEVVERGGASTRADAPPAGFGERHPEFAAYVDAQIALRHAAAEPPD